MRKPFILLVNKVFLMTVIYLKSVSAAIYNGIFLADYIQKAFMLSII